MHTQEMGLLWLPSLLPTLHSEEAPRSPLAHLGAWVPLHSTHAVTPSGCSLHPHRLCPGRLPGQGLWSHGATKVFAGVLFPLHALSPKIQIPYTSFLLIFKQVSKVSVQLHAVIESNSHFPPQHYSLCTVRVLDPHTCMHTCIIYCHIFVLPGCPDHLTWETGPIWAGSCLMA